MKAAFGIDFGTTNTRVAYFNGKSVRAVPFATSEGTVYQFPTAIAYRHGEPVAYGHEALLVKPQSGTLFPKPLKWLLRAREPVEVGDGETREPVDIVADFLTHIRQQVSASLTSVPLDRAAVTIPVQYPADARRQLHEAFKRAGIAVTQFFFEPIAAIYAGSVGDPAAGVAAVFDWGGGSLDIATVRVRDGVALTQHIDGWDRGGVDFDRAVAEQAVDGFFARHKEHPSAEGLSTEKVLRGMYAGQEILRLAEKAKLRLTDAPEASLQYVRFLGIDALNYRLTRAGLSELVGRDLAGALAHLERALAGSGVTPRTLSRLFLSGGTCRLRDVRETITPQYGERLVTQLRLPKRFVDPLLAGGLDDIGNATAVGAALLAAADEPPRFAADIGVRLAGQGRDRFLCIYKANDVVVFNKTVPLKLFVTHAAGGTAQLLVCDRGDDVTQADGRLLRALTVPINRDEKFLNVEFAVTAELNLAVRAAGQTHQTVNPTRNVAWPNPVAFIPDLKFGFRLPTD